MSEKISVIGGDLRASSLAKMFEEDGNEVSVYGMEKSDEIMEDQGLKKCKSVKEAIENSDVIIGSVPFAKDSEKMYAVFSDKDIEINDLVKKKYKGKIFIAGGIDKKSYDILSQKYEKVIDVMKREDLVILNTIATAEGTIKLAIENTDKILQGSNILVLGFGRVGKVVANKFQAMNTKVTCAARKSIDLAWMNAFGYESLNINNLGQELEKFDIIINTVPQMIINKNLMKYMKKDVLMIDLASNPGGINREDAKDLNLKLIWALALPGKIAPVSSAKFIKETIYNALSEE